MANYEVKNIHNIDLSGIKIKENSWIAKLAAKKLKINAVAIVLGKTIHLYKVSRNNFLSDERWLKHEACHIRQFEENGYFIFIFKYLWQSLKHGYYNNKYEKEARLAEEI